jgi:hypothetical protein
MNQIKTINGDSLAYFCSDNRKTIWNTTSKLIIIVSVVILAACTPTTKPDPNTNEYVLEDFKDIEVLDARQVFLTPIERVYFNGEIVNYEIVKDKIKYPYFHTVMTDDEIEKGYVEGIKRVIKALYKKDYRKAGDKDLSLATAHEFESIEQYIEVFNKYTLIESELAKRIFDGEFGEKFRKYSYYDNDKQSYVTSFDFLKITNDLVDKEFFFRLYQTKFQIELEILNDFDIEYDPVIFDCNPLQIKL